MKIGNLSIHWHKRQKKIDFLEDEIIRIERILTEDAIDIEKLNARIQILDSTQQTIINRLEELTKLLEKINGNQELPR